MLCLGFEPGPQAKTIALSYGDRPTKIIGKICPFWFSLKAVKDYNVPYLTPPSGSTSTGRGW